MLSEPQSQGCQAESRAMARGSQLELEPWTRCINHWRWCLRESKWGEISWLHLSYCQKQKEAEKPGNPPERSKRDWFRRPPHFNSSLTVNSTFYWVLVPSFQGDLTIRLWTKCFGSPVGRATKLAAAVQERISEVPEVSGSLPGGKEEQAHSGGSSVSEVKRWERTGQLKERGQLHNSTNLIYICCEARWENKHYSWYNLSSNYRLSYSKCFLKIDSFNTHKNPLRYILLLHFTDEENEV